VSIDLSGFVASKQATRKIAPWVDKAIEAHGNGEQVLWESGLVPGQQNVVLVLLFWLPGLTPDSIIQGSVPIENPIAITEEQIDDILSRFLFEMKQARSKALADQMPKSGLIH
jgi:hypothetical protein